MRVSAKMLSSSLRSRASRYRGTRLAANGRKRVEMKKNSASCVLLIGLIASAYAAGRPSTRTRNVDPRLANAELMKYGGETPGGPARKEDGGGREKGAAGGHAAPAPALLSVPPPHRTPRRNS